MQDRNRPSTNLLEIELAAEMLSSLLHDREDIMGEAMVAPGEERRYEIAFRGFAELIDELRNEHGDERMPGILAQMTLARRDALRAQLQQRERREQGR